MTKLEVSRLVATLVAAFQPPRWSEEAQRVYEQMLADLELEPTKQAVARLINVSRFMPTIAEIRESATALQHGPVRPGAEAWGDVLAAIRSVGGYEPQPEFSDPVVAQIVTAFGWCALCFGGDGVADRARFVQAYDELARQQRLDLVSGVPLPRRLAAAFRPAPTLPPTPGPERSATAELGGNAGALWVDLPKLPARNPNAVWTGRRLTQAELDTELEKTGSDHG